MKSSPISPGDSLKLHAKALSGVRSDGLIEVQVGEDGDCCRFAVRAEEIAEHRAMKGDADA